MVKAITLFLIFIAVVAMFGKLGWLGRQIGIGKSPRRMGKQASCPRCGRYIIGKDGCDCGAPPEQRG